MPARPQDATHRYMSVQSRYTDRDYQLMEWLYDHGLLTTPQISEALFPSLRFCQQRLHRLMQAGLIERFRLHRPGGGSYPYNYLLTHLGAEQVAVQRHDELPRPDTSAQRIKRLTDRGTTPHLIGINTFFTNLAGYARRHPPAALRRWLPSTRFQKPGGFIAFDNDPAHLLTPRPTPDGYAEWHDQGNDIAFFLEFDRGTETLSVLIEKIRRYDQIGDQPLPVLFLLPTDEREYNLHKAITDHELAHANIATASETYMAATLLNPAQEVWWAVQHAEGRVRLSQVNMHPSPSSSDKAMFAWNPPGVARRST